VSGTRLPLAVSIAGHATGLVVLAWLSTRLPPLVPTPPAPPNAIAVIFEAPPAPPPPIPPPQATEIKPPPPPPPPPIPEVAAMPPPIPEIRQLPKPKPLPRREVRRHIERPLPAPPPPVTMPQTASLPPPAPRPPAAPLVSAAYRSALADWFASHKDYPESARDRGEQGQALLRLRVDRSGRVLNYALVRSTGYPDLDREIETIMHGAVLPPFPADMAASDIEVTIPFAFRLER
jgi:periplasmic protein TonB